MSRKIKILLALTEVLDWNSALNIEYLYLRNIKKLGWGWNTDRLMRKKLIYSEVSLYETLALTFGIWRLVVWSPKSFPKKVRLLHSCHCSCALSDNMYSESNMHLRLCSNWNTCIDNEDAKQEACKVQNNNIFFKQHWKSIRENM